MTKYESILDLQRLVAEGATEDVSLEFKGQRITEKDLQQAISDLASEISAFANSAGGTLIIGIDESKEKEKGLAPVAVEVCGLTDPRWRSEWLAAKLEGKVHPPIDGVSITEVPTGRDERCLVITVPRSIKAPHQAPDKKYYARRQFQKMPMAHYELEDVRNRRRVRRPEVRLSLVFIEGTIVELRLENIGDSPVFNLKVGVPDAARAAFKLEAPALTDRITALNPGERIGFHVGYVSELFEQESLRSDTLIDVVYEHEDGSAGRQLLVLNLSNHDRSIVFRSDVDRLRQEIGKQLRDLKDKIEEGVRVLRETLGAIASPTGLSISADTLTRLPGSDQTPKKWNANQLDGDGFQEVLGCTSELGHSLSWHFRHRFHQPFKLADVEGMTEEMAERLRERIELPGETLD